MDSQTSDTFERMFYELKSQEYDLKKLDNNEIIIRGVPTVTPFMIIMMIVIGSVLVLVGIISLTLTSPDLIAGILFIAVGIFLIILPFYNYYSKRNFEININRKNEQISIHTVSVGTGKSIIPFSDITNLIIKKSVTNTFVDDRSKSSTMQNFAIELDLKDQSNPTLVRFFRKDDKTEEFSNYFADYLAEFMKKDKRHILIE